MNLYESTGHVVKHVAKVITHVAEHKAANQVVNKAISSGKKILPTPKPKAKVGFFDNIHTPFQFFLHFPWIIPIIIIGIYAGIHFGWKKLDLAYNMKGQPLAPFKDYVKRIRAVMYKEDLTAVFTKPQFLVQKFPGFVWQSFWRIVTVMVLVEFALLLVWPSMIVLILLIPIILICLFGVKHIKLVFSIRMRTMMQMFEVAEASMKYAKGANLNPWGYIIIQSWGNPEAPNFTAIDNLYSPGPTYVMYNAKFPSEDQRNRDAFEKNFNGTVSDQHTWTYEWESANNRVLCSPVPFIPATIVPYPFPDRSPWNRFPLGEAAGGKEAFLDVKVFPHLLIAGVTGSGKQLTLGIDIPTPNGWKKMGDLEVGDYVFDENGKPCQIFGLSDIDENPDLYRVSFSDGSYIDADGEHMWRTETRQSLRSRWEAKTRIVQRRSLITEKNIKNLQAFLLTLSPTDEVTLEQVSSIAGVHGSPWFIDVAKEVGHVGEIRLRVKHHYKAQIVRQHKEIFRYPARETWSAFATVSGRGTSILNSKKELFLTHRDMALENDTVTATDIVKISGLNSNAQVRQLLKRKGIEGIVTREIIELNVPEKTVEKLSKFTKSYNGHALINAILNRVETPANDQRHMRTFSAVRTTSEIMKTIKTSSGHINHSIPVTKPLDLPEAELPIHPYLLGVFLGDGLSRQGAFCGVDPEISEHIKSDGYTVVERSIKNVPNKPERHPDFRIWTVKGLRRTLKQEGLLQETTIEGTKKHIPEKYLRASISQRWMLLAGLLDTDGTVSGSGAMLYNTNPHIAFGAYELAISLGHRATIREGRSVLNGKDYGSRWEVFFTCRESPFRLSRKTKIFNENSKNLNSEKIERRYITSVEKIPSVPARCLQVDSPSRMFLAGRSMIPTRNSVTQRTLLMHVLQSPDWRVALVDPKRVELSSYKTHPNVVAVATELDESAALIEKVEQEMQSRYILMQKEGVNFFQNLTTPPPALLLMVDETYALLAPEKIKNDEGKERDDMHARITLLIGSIARLGRAAGVHMILATQRPDAAVLPGETKANLDARIAQGRMDSTPSNMTLDSDAATRIPNIKGRAVLRTGNEFTEFQAYFLPEQQLELVLEMAGALATGQVDISAFDDDEPQMVESGKKGFRLPKLSLRMPRIPANPVGRLKSWFEGRKALAEGNDARSKAAREGAIASEGRGKSGRGSKGQDDSRDRQKGFRGRRDRSPGIYGEDDTEEELDIDAIAEAAKARGLLSGMDLDPNHFYNPLSSGPASSDGPSYADAEEYDSSQFEDEDFSSHRDLDEGKEFVPPIALDHSPIVPVVFDDDDEIPDRDTLIRLAQEREDNVQHEVSPEVIYRDSSDIVTPVIVPGTIQSVSSISINDISVDEVLRRAAQRGVAIPASELLAALRYEAKIAESGGIATPIPVPTSVKMPVVEGVPVPVPTLPTANVESTPIPVPVAPIAPITGMPVPPVRVEPQPVIAEVTSNEAPWMPKEIQKSDTDDSPFGKR